MRAGVTLGEFIRDMSGAVRLMAKRPGTYTAATFSLALSAGGTITAFSLLNALVFSPLPVSSPEKLIEIVAPGSTNEFPQESFPGDLCLTFRHVGQPFSDIFTMGYPDDTVLYERDGAAQYVQMGSISGNGLQILGVRTLMGRLLNASDAPEGAARVAVVTEAFWRNRLNRDPQVLGRRLSLQSGKCEVVGVLAGRFYGIDAGAAPEIWVPSSDQQVGRVFARLRDKAQPSLLLAKLQPSFRDYLQSRADPRLRQGTSGYSLRSVSAARGVSGTGLRQRFARILTIATIAAGLVTLIACANVALLLLAQGATRTREFAVRRALGAGSARIAMQLLSETTLLAVISCLLGAVLARWMSAVGASLLSDFERPVRLSLNIDIRVIGLYLAFCLIVLLGSGLAPVIYACRNTLNETMRGGADKLLRNLGGLPIGKLVIIVQVALLFVLLVGAGLFYSSMRNLRSVDLGFDRDHILIADLQWEGRGKDTAYTDPVYRELLQRLARLPSVASVSISGWSYFADASRRAPIVVEGRVSRSGIDPSCEFLSVGPGFFRTMGTRVLLGREFDHRDTPDMPAIAIINEAAAKLYFGSESPIGKRFYLFDPKQLMEIVGIVRNVKLNSVRDTTPPMVYLPFLQSEYRGTSAQPASIALRTTINAALLTGSLQREIRSLGTTLRVSRVRTQEALVEKSFKQEHSLFIVLESFGIFALLLGAVGLYGLTNHGVARRTKELALRLALGCTRPSLITMIVSEALLLVAVGILVGAPVATAATQMIRALLFNVQSIDIPVLLGVVATLVLVTIVAAWVPAYRVSFTDIASSLRED